MIGGMEWILLLAIVVLLLFGAKKIPEFARGLGKARAEFQRGQMMVEREIREERERYDAEERERKAKAERSKKQSKVQKAAEALGIDTEGKTDAELKKEIAENMA